MSNTYTFDPPSASVTRGFTICTVHYASRQDDFPDTEGKYSRNLEAKCYTGLSFSEVDALMGEALRIIYNPPSRKCRLLDVVVDKSKSIVKKYEVKFVLEKLEESIEPEVLKRDDRLASTPRYFNGYRLGKAIYVNDDSGIGVYLAKSPSGEDVVIKRSSYGTFFETNPMIREGVYQARLQHPNTCRLLDMFIAFIADRFEVNLVMERMPISLKKDISDCVKSGSRYSEEEIFRCLKEVGAALLNGKQLVISKQRIAHRDIKPANILLSDKRQFKLTDFGIAWEFKDRSETVDKSGTLYYEAAEVRTETSNHPFPADIFSLGMTILHMAILKFDKSDANVLESTEEPKRSMKIEALIDKMKYSDVLKRVVRQMTANDPNQRPNIEILVKGIFTVPNPLSIHEHLIQPLENDVWRQFDEYHDYEIGCINHEDKQCGLKVYIARYLVPRGYLQPLESGLKKRFFAKCYEYCGIEDVEKLLKEALFQIRKQYTKRCKLVDVFINPPNKKYQIFTVVYMLELLEDQVEEEALKRNDHLAFHRKGLEGYTTGYNISTNPYTRTKVKKATSVTTG